MIRDSYDSERFPQYELVLLRYPDPAYIPNRWSILTRTDMFPSKFIAARLKNFDSLLLDEPEFIGEVCAWS